MLSRVADSLYWMARYIERAENTARFIDVNLQLSLDAPRAFSEQWEPLVAITGELESFLNRYEVPTRDNVLQFLTLDKENPSSIVSCLTNARENARSMREIISSETWEQVNRFYLLVSNRAAARRAFGDSAQFYSDVRVLSQLISGVANNTMSHGESWHFMEMGRFLERADNTSRLLDMKYFLLLPSVEDVGGAVDELQWSVLLNSASALEMYRKKYGQIEPENVIDFLLVDQEFPRAILFCLLNAEESLHSISGSRVGGYANQAERRLGQLRSELAYAQVYEIIARGLHEFLDGLQGKLNTVGEAIAGTFFGVEAEQNQSMSLGGLNA